MFNFPENLSSDPFVDKELLEALQSKIDIDKSFKLPEGFVAKTFEEPITSYEAPKCAGLSEN